MSEYLISDPSSLSGVSSTSSISSTDSSSKDSNMKAYSDCSRKSSLSSSGPDFRSVHSEIIYRNLMTDFMAATSLPVNVPIHRYREASRPSTPMREEFERCARQLPYSLASKLLSTPSYKVLEFLGEEFTESYRCVDTALENKNIVEKKKSEEETEAWGNEDLMFKIEM